MSLDFADIMREFLRPRAAIPTGLAPKLKPLPQIRAVLFDVYGTLLISSTGDIELTARPKEDLEWALRQTSVPFTARAGDPDYLREEIERRHEELRSNGVAYPEVDILDIWSRVLRRLKKEGRISWAPDGKEALRWLAARHELRGNPVWRMPFADVALNEFARRGIVMGIVSNAQFYTPLVLCHLFDRATLGEIGFQEDLCVFSYLHGIAKPDTTLFALVLERLRRRGIEPEQTLYMGNDVRNDIQPAARLKIRTALFAGDFHGLRLREEDERFRGVAPDLVLTRWDQILDCVARTDCKKG